MKSLEQFKSLNVLTINEGMDCGKTTELLIDPANKQVDLMLIDSGIGCLGYKLLPVQAIKSVGVEFITITSQADLISFKDTVGALNNMISSKQLIGLRVISDEGFTLGSITEFFVDEKTCVILEIKISNGDNVLKENIHAITRNLVTISTPNKETGTQEFKQKTNAFLVGKVVTHDIYDQEGKAFIKAGETVTANMVKMLEGKDELIQLTLNVK